MRAFILLFIAIFLFGCVAEAGLGGMSVPLSPANLTANPTFILAPPNATATPTPFQPFKPTDAYYPTSQPPEKIEIVASPTATISVPSSKAPQPKLEKVPNQINILLLGSDKRPSWSNYRTDTIILVTLNSKLGQVNITSFPRDLYVMIPGWGMDRINTAWTNGGRKLLYATLEHNFGIVPDYFVLAHFFAFKNFVDDLGGLDVPVTEQVSDYRSGYWITVPAGEVHMDADLVLWYVRSRKTTNDFARNRRQQEVLQAIIVKLLSINGIRRAPEIFKLYRSSVRTDFKTKDVLAWLPFAARVARNPDIHMYAIGNQHVYDWVTPMGAMVLIPDQQAVMDVIRKSQNLR